MSLFTCDRCGKIWDDKLIDRIQDPTDHALEICGECYAKIEKHKPLYADEELLDMEFEDRINGGMED